MEYVLQFLLGLIPGAFWMAYFLMKDKKRPEPRKVIFAVFLSGMLSIFIALVYQVFAIEGLRYLFGLGEECGIAGIGDPAITTLCPSLYVLSAFGLVSVIEELTKFFAAYLIIRKTIHFDEPIDSMIYIITAALGFATVENILYIGSASGTLESFVLTIMRFMGATLMHAVASGMMGYYLLRGNLAFGFVLAVGIHTAFNGLAVFLQNLIYPTAMILFALFFLSYSFDAIREETD